MTTPPQPPGGSPLFSDQNLPPQEPGQAPSLPGPSAPQLSFFTLRSQRGRGPRLNAPPPQITVTVSAEVSVSHVSNTNSSPNLTPNPFPTSNKNTYSAPNPTFNTPNPQSTQAIPSTQANKPTNILPAPPLNIYPTRGNSRDASGGRDHRPMASGSGSGFGTGNGSGRGQIQGRKSSEFTPPTASFTASTSTSARSSFGHSGGPNSGSSAGSGVLPGGLVPPQFPPGPSRPYARVRGTGLTVTGRGGYQTFTPHSPSPVRAGNVNVPSFTTQSSSPLGSASGSGSRTGDDSSHPQSPSTPTPMGLGQGTDLGTGTDTGTKRLTATSTPFQPLDFAASISAPTSEYNTSMPTKDGTDTHSDVAPTKTDTDAETEQEEEEADLGPDTKTPTLTLSKATQLLQLSTSPTIAEASSFPTLSISVALYSPLGSFLPPLQPLILTSSTTLKSLVLKLQEHLLTNLRHSGSLAKLLVQSIQVRVFDLEGMDGMERLGFGLDSKTGRSLTLTLPRIEGRLSGDAGEGGMVVGKTKWVAWEATGGEGESERFWGTLVRKLLVDVLRRGDREEGGKAPMLKVRTVVKVGEVVDGGVVMGERVAGGGHLFRVPAGAILPAKGIIAENIITPRGSLAAQGGKQPEKRGGGAEMKDDNGKAKENKAKKDKRDTNSDTDDKAEASTRRHQRGSSDSADNLFASTSALDSSLQPALSRKFHKIHKPTKRSQAHRESLYMAPADDNDKIAYAHDILRRANLADKANKMEAEMLTKIEAASGPSQIGKKGEKGHYERLLGGSASQQVWVQKGGYPKNAPFDPNNNWGVFASWGEKPTDPDYENRKALHEAFPLSNIPFNGPTCEPWNRPGKEIGPSSDVSGAEQKNQGPKKTVPFAVLDAEEFKQQLVEESNKPENLPLHIKQYWEEQERIKSMDELDDDIFFPAANPDGIEREQASKVFAAKEFKNPTRNKNLDIISKLQGPIQRRSVSNSAYLNSLIADGLSNLYDNMPTTGSFQLGPGTTLNHSHAAADNTFKSSLQDIPSFSAFAKQNIKLSSPDAGFYELSKAVITHTPIKEPDSFISNLHGPDTQAHEGEPNQQASGASFSDFNPMDYGYGETQTAGSYNGFNAMSNEQQGDGYIVMGGNMMGGGLMSENMTGSNNTMGGSNMGNSMMGSLMGGSNQTPTSFNSFGTASGGPSDLRGIVTHGYLATPNLPNSGWTSMNTGGATYNSFGGQSNSFNPTPRTTANTPQNRATGSFPQYSQSSLPTPTPAGRMQSRFFEPMDNPRPTHGSERSAFNNMSVPHNTTHPAAGSFVNPMTTPTNQTHPAAGSYVHGSVHSRTHGLHVGSNPTAASRARRTAAIPIVAPPGHSSLPGFQLPSPSRQAIGYGVGIGSSAPLGLGTPGNVRGISSPDKKAKDEFSAAIANAFNGPKGSPAGGSNA
ncbi:hypothetical protein ONS95_005062 [Cadophora gregata]|uniref:uncharacterized protein n=1 Tax=Cadophora gregata TaxID=51156 RepID=UPI0026DD06A3|nr:uncharacterized protein ONS95_005062 [Cadophora gregata]KAK0104794.1 hypothetical protein ONS95_005062 [Cadophora gregata]